MAVLPLARFEHAVRGEKTQDATQSFRMGADRYRQLGGCSRRLVQLVGNGKVATTCRPLERQ